MNFGDITDGTTHECPIFVISAEVFQLRVSRRSLTSETRRNRYATLHWRLDLAKT